MLPNEVYWKYWKTNSQSNKCNAKNDRFLLVQLWLKSFDLLLKILLAAAMTGTQITFPIIILATESNEYLKKL